MTKEYELLETIGINVGMPSLLVILPDTMDFVTCLGVVSMAFYNLARGVKIFRTIKEKKDGKNNGSDLLDS